MTKHYKRAPFEGYKYKINFIFIKKMKKIQWFKVDITQNTINEIHNYLEDFGNLMQVE